MDSGCNRRVSEWPRYLLTLSSFFTLLDASLKAEEVREGRDSEN